MNDAIEYIIKARKLVLEAQDDMPDTKVEVTIASMLTGFPGRFTVTSPAVLGEDSWKFCLFEAQPPSDAAPSIRVIGDHTADDIISLIGDPIIGTLAAGDNGWMLPGPLKGAHIAVNSFSKAALKTYFLGGGTVDPLGIRLSTEDFSSAYKNFDGTSTQASALINVRFVMLGDDSVAIRNTLLLSCAVDQFMRIVERGQRASRQKGRAFTVSTEPGTRLGYDAQLFHTTDEGLDKRPVIVADMSYPVNFS